MAPRVPKQAPNESPLQYRNRLVQIQKQSVRNLRWMAFVILGILSLSIALALFGISDPPLELFGF